MSAALAELLDRLLSDPVPRRPTEEEIQRAAWANLAVDRPGFTWEEAQRIYGRDTASDMPSKS